MVWTKEFIQQVLSKSHIDPLGYTGEVRNKVLVYKMLQALYKRQTDDEQHVGVTKVHNKIGFNGTDSAFLSSVALGSQPYKGLTAGQTKSAAKLLKKYAGQLASIAAEKAVPTVTTKDNQLTLPEAIKPTTMCSKCGDQPAEIKTEGSATSGLCGACADRYWDSEFAHIEQLQEMEAFACDRDYQRSMSCR